MILLQTLRLERWYTEPEFLNRKIVARYRRKTKSNPAEHTVKSLDLDLDAYELITDRLSERWTERACRV